MALPDDTSNFTVHVQGLVAESGEQAGFDARAWLDHWLTGVVPALGNRRHVEVLNEPDGQEQVRSVLLQAQSGTHS